MPRFQVLIEDSQGRMRPFELVLDKNQQPQWTSHRLPPIHITLYQQTAEARYASAVLGSGGASGTGSVHAQDDISGGMGKKVGVRKEETYSDRYYYTDWLDASVRGQTQKGPAVVTLTPPANSTGVTGLFALNNRPYLVMGQIVASWTSDTLTQEHDFGGGRSGNAVGFFTLQTAGRAASQLNFDAFARISTADGRVAQKIVLNVDTAAFLSSMHIWMRRVGLDPVGTPVVTTSGAAGAVTYNYKVTALSGTDETAASTAGVVTTGNATLTSSNYNVITWARVANASGYKIYRTSSAGTPSTTGYIGSASSLTDTFNDTGIPADGSSPPGTDATGKVPGDVRVSLQADKNGAPSGTIIASARRLANSIPLTGTEMIFNFEDVDTLALGYKLPYWFVVDATGAAPAFFVDVMTYSVASSYANGFYSTSTDGGNSWTSSSPLSANFDLYTKSPKTEAFIGKDHAVAFNTTADGAAYAADPTPRYAMQFATVGSRLIRVVANSLSAIGSGLLEWTEDGINWNEDLIVVGDPGVPINTLVRMGDVLIAAKYDGIYAIDILNPTIDVEQVYSGGSSSVNGQGACEWRGAAYIPFNGRLMAVEGSFTAGFTVHESVGIEAFPEWDWPWGPGYAHTACAGTRHHLYSIVNTAAGDKLFKSANPLRKNADGTADPEWHGSLATVADGSSPIRFMAHYDPGGNGSPQLFFSNATSKVLRIKLPRSFNPAADPTGYDYDTSTTGDLYLPETTAGYPVHPKAWLNETVTFAKSTSGDYAEMLYDLKDGESWRRMPTARLYDTGALAYPREASSRVIARRLRLANSASTASPLLLAYAVSWAARPIKGAQLRELTFSVVAEDGLSAADLGESLGIGAASQQGLLDGAAADLLTRRMEDPYGNKYERVIFLDTTDQLAQEGSGGSGGRAIIQVSALGVVAGAAVSPLESRAGLPPSVRPWRQE